MTAASIGLNTFSESASGDESKNMKRYRKIGKKSEKSEKKTNDHTYITIESAFGGGGWAGGNAVPAARRNFVLFRAALRQNGVLASPKVALFSKYGDIKTAIFVKFRAVLRPYSDELPP